MIKAFFGLKRNPFDKNNLTLTNQQQSVFDIVNVHSRQGGLCVIAGEPGSGKTAILNAIQKLSKDKSVEVPTISRTMHSYQNVVKILLDAFGLDDRHLIKDCEISIIKEAFKLNSNGKTLITIIDDAHLLQVNVLRKLRLLFDEFPRNHNLVLIGQTQLLARIATAENADIKSRITYSVHIKPINPNQIQEVILSELDKAGLAHSTFDEGALELIIRNSNGLLRQCKNIVLGSLIHASVEGKKVINSDIVNSILIQPHWKKYDELAKVQ